MFSCSAYRLLRLKFGYVRYHPRAAIGTILVYFITAAANFMSNLS